MLEQYIFPNLLVMVEI